MKSGKTMTAAEGADAVAARGRRLANNDVGPLYNCESCGAHDFDIVRHFAEEKIVVEILDCECDNEEEFAGRREVRVTYQNTWIGQLDEDHHFEWNDKEHESEYETLEFEIECQDCVDEADPEEWYTDEDDDPEVIEDEDRWEVRCATCDHEIEFGWSHPGRAGRIWPCESADFNPWKSVPEDRFVDAWRARGWLRPTRGAKRSRL